MIGGAIDQKIRSTKHKQSRKSPCGQWPPVQIRRVVEVSLHEDPKRASLTANELATVRQAGWALWRLFGHRVIAAECSGVRRLEIPREQLCDSVDRMIGDPLEHRTHKGFWVVTIEFGAADKAVDRRSSLATGIATHE